ncbi:MAG: hypothetical protein QOE55_709 [Acidobacteriaceae bacterium]|nr:hypothetical protein [Acidobacteriaceae bacterium]
MDRKAAGGVSGGLELQTKNGYSRSCSTTEFGFKSTGAITINTMLGKIWRKLVKRVSPGINVFQRASTGLNEGRILVMLKHVEKMWFSIRYPKDKATRLQGKSGYLNDCKNGAPKIGV